MTKPLGAPSSMEPVGAALARGDFASAWALLEPMDDEAPEVLEARAVAAYGVGRFETCLAAWERLHDVHLAAGEQVAAARAGAMVAINLLCETALMAPVRGWTARVRALLGDAEPGPVHALLAVIGTYERFLTGDAEAALDRAREAVELGVRFDVAPAQGLGRAAIARLAIAGGDVEAGIALLDELAVDLAAGRFDPLTTGNTYCELICAALWVGRPDLAREWTDLMDRWRTGPAFGATHGRCRVHRAELLRLSGPAAEAEDEALAACEELRPWMRREFGWPLVELGNIRLRRGDLEGAEESFAAAHARAWSAQPGWALLRLEQGDAATGAAMLREELARPTALPWKERPPLGDLWQVPLLAAQAEVALAAGDVDLAEESAGRLAAVLARHPSCGLEAEALLARARAELVARRWGDAVAAARAALLRWVDLGAPYDAAQARMVIAGGLAGAGDLELARTEWRAAAVAFDEFGAPHRAAAARALAESGESSAGARVDVVPPGPEVVELVAEPGRWRLVHRGREVSLPDLKGVRLLARLLAEPGREHEAVELAGASVVVPGLPVLDAEAVASYRRRLAEVEADLAEAERDCDEARRELASRDREFLLAELSGAVGLAGRARTTGGTAERARTSVTRSLRYGIARIADHAPDLAAHLDAAVRTGAWCSYRPDPVAPLEWRVVT